MTDFSEKVTKINSQDNPEFSWLLSIIYQK